MIDKYPTLKEIFKNLDDMLRTIAYERGHSAGEDEVAMIYDDLAHDIFSAIERDIEEAIAGLKIIPELKAKLHE